MKEDILYRGLYVVVDCMGVFLMQSTSFVRVMLVLFSLRTLKRTLLNFEVLLFFFSSFCSTFFCSDPLVPAKLLVVWVLLIIFRNLPYMRMCAAVSVTLPNG